MQNLIRSVSLMRWNEYKTSTFQLNTSNRYINLSVSLLFREKRIYVRWKKKLRKKRLKSYNQNIFVIKSKTPFLSHRKPSYIDNKSENSNMQSHSVNNPFILCGMTVQDISNRRYLIKYLLSVILLFVSMFFLFFYSCLSEYILLVTFKKILSKCMTVEIILTIWAMYYVHILLGIISSFDITLDRLVIYKIRCVSCESLGDT